MYWSMTVPRSRSTGRAGQIGDQTNRASGRPANAATGGGGAGGRFEYEPETTGFLGKWRLTQNAGNDYGIDRELQTSGATYTGIPGIFQQDQAVTESMGAIYQRDHEHLGTSDSMIIRTRRRVIRAAQALRDSGTIPPGVDDPEIYRTRSGSVILPRSANWLDATQHARWPQVPAGEPVEVGV
jgi:hypothetical protein